MLSDFPPLQFPEKDRPREYNQYSDIQRAEMIYRYLFEGLSARSLDKQILGLNPDQSKGYQSHGVLRHCGISGDPHKGHKGKLIGMPLQAVIGAMKKRHIF